MYMIVLKASLILLLNDVLKPDLFSLCSRRNSSILSRGNISPILLPLLSLLFSAQVSSFRGKEEEEEEEAVAVDDLRPQSCKERKKEEEEKT